MRILRASLAVSICMLVLDLLWLGVVGQGLYDDRLGALKAKEVVVVAAALFYLQYVAVIVAYCVLPSQSRAQAARRGLGVGWIAYATYEFTNWAVIEGWPASLVPIDIAWGLALTTLVAVVGWTAAGSPDTGDGETATA